MHKPQRLKMDDSLRWRISIVLITAIILQLFLQNFGVSASVEELGFLSVPVAIDKTVNGIPIKEVLGDNFSSVQPGMKFEIYKMDFETITPVIGEGDVPLVVELSVDGRIRFTADEPGWYVVKEILTPNSDAALTFAEVDPLYIYIGPNGVMSSLGKSNAEGYYRVAWGGSNAGLTLVYEHDGTEYTISGVKPDGSGQNLMADSFMSLMPDGAWINSYCADLGAHNVWGDYVHDTANHGFGDHEMYYIIAAFDYINDLFWFIDQWGNPILPGEGEPWGQPGLDIINGKILAQVVLWNLILKVDKNAGYADNWAKYVVDIPDEAKVVRIEGTPDWYDNWTCQGRTYREIAEDIIENPEDYVGIYMNKLNRTLTRQYVTGVVFIKGAEGSGYDPIDQQRQLIALFGHNVKFDNRYVYDVALRKWVSKVGETSIGTPGVPNTTVPPVQAGDKVTFSIEVYNQTHNTTVVTKLVDYFPAGYEFDENDNPLWRVTENPWWIPGSHTTLEYKGSSILLPGYGDSATVEVVLTVKADEADYRNAAEVLEITDVNGKKVEDADSTFTDEQRRNWNRHSEKDNEIDENGKNGGDKDDYDFAEVVMSVDWTGVKVIKIWEDGNNVAGLRPASITVNLY